LPPSDAAETPNANDRGILIHVHDVNDSGGEPWSGASRGTKSRDASESISTAQAVML
jgi:hypothetical protein